MTRFRELVKELADARELLVQLTIRDLRIRYKQALMGIAWSILMPMLIILAGAVVRLAMTQLSGEDLDLSSVGTVTIKAVPWAFFISAVASATSSLTANATLVSKVYFVREVLPLSAVLAQAFDSIVGAFFVAALLPFVGGTASWALMWVPALCLILVLLTIGAALALSCANLFFRDVKYLVQVMSTFGIFFTPVLFEAGALGSRGSGLIMLNPLAPLFEGLGVAAIRGHNLLTPLTEHGVVVWEPWYLAYSIGWAIAVLVAGAALFHRAEYVFAEYV